MHYSERLRRAAFSGDLACEELSNRLLEFVNNYDRQKKFYN
jgi:hypothetical protein